MGRTWGTQVGNWQCYLDSTPSTTNSQVVIPSSVIGFHSIGYGFDIHGLTAQIGYTDTSENVSDNRSATFDVYAPNGSYTDVTGISQGQWVFNRKHAGYNAIIWGNIVNASGFEDGQSTVEMRAWVPAKDSWSVTYNANGGTGAPGGQTKWRDEALTLSTAKPTRNGYTFKGWATSKTATSASVQPGASYTANAGATYYAVWSLNHARPTISKMSAFRCDSAHTASSSGTYAYVSTTWKTDGSASSVKVEYSADNSTWTGAKSTTVSGTSGTTSITVGDGKLTGGATWYFRATVTDAAGYSTVSWTCSISPSVPMIKLRTDGTGIELGKQLQSFQTGGNWLAAKNGANAALRMPDNATAGSRFDAWLAAVGKSGITTAIGTLGSGDVTLISLLSGRTNNATDHRMTWYGDSGDLFVANATESATISEANLMRLLAHAGSIPYIIKQGTSVDGGGATWYYEQWSTGRTHAFCKTKASSFAITRPYGSAYYQMSGTWSVAGGVPGTNIVSVQLQPLSGTGLVSAAVNSVSGKTFSFFLFDQASETLNVAMMCDVWLV